MTPGSDAPVPSRPGEGTHRSDGRAAGTDGRDTAADGRATGGDEDFQGRAFAPREDGTVLGVGIDVVDIDHLAERIGRTPALLERLFTPGERNLSAASRAARVAAKEAVGKALGRT